MTTSGDPCVVLVGTLCDGYTAFGPFASYDAADDWSSRCTELTWIMTMTPIPADIVEPRYQADHSAIGYRVIDTTATSIPDSIVCSCPSLELAEAVAKAMNAGDTHGQE